MGILTWILFGALVGWISSLILGTDERMGALANITLGIVGAFVGGALMNTFGSAGVTGFNLYSTLVAIIGALITVAVARAITH
jgi:uncharacterized membrane protein YeaQ/YmgE (transglycosylase-associated protein family)